MSWKDYLYFQKRDRIAIILLLILIVISGGLYTLTKQSLHTDKISGGINKSEKFEEFQANLKEIESKKIEVDQPSKFPKYTHQEKFAIGETVELNNADTSDLKKIPGIGTGYANKIVKYRTLLGGYMNITQLKEVWGMDDDLYNKITPYLTIKPKGRIIKINSAEFDELNKHPYINYKQAKVIEDIRQRKGKIESMDRLSLLEEFTENDLRRLKSYVSFD